MIVGTSFYTNEYVNATHDSLDNVPDIASEHMEEEATKCEYKINVTLDDVSLEKSNFSKFLGVIIDKNLTWKNHIDAISKTISRNIGLLVPCTLYLVASVTSGDW